MTATSTLTRKNQTTIPVVVVRALGLHPSSQLVYEIEEGRVILTAKTKTFAELANSFPRKGQKAATLEEMQKAVAEGATERYRQSSS